MFTCAAAAYKGHAFVIPDLQHGMLFLTLKKQYTFSVYFYMPTSTFLFLTLLAYRVRSGLFFSQRTI